MSSSGLVVLAALAAGSVVYAAPGIPVGSAVDALEPLLICHARIVREAPSVRLQRLAEMRTDLSADEGK